MNVIEQFENDLIEKSEIVTNILEENGIFAKPTIELLATIQAEKNDLYVNILSEMYGEEFDEYISTANANGEGAERVINASSGFFATLMSPLTTLNAALGNIFGGGSVNSEAIASIEASIEATEESASKYRTMAIIGIIVCIVLCLVLILKK